MVPSKADTSTTYSLSTRPACVGLSKLGAVTKVRAPVTALIANFAESAPPVIENVGTSLSASVATTVVTATMFSTTFTAAVAPPPLLVMAGELSFTFVIVTVMV